MTVRNHEARLDEGAKQIVALLTDKVDLNDPDEQVFGFSMLMQAALAWHIAMGWPPERTDDVFRLFRAELVAELTERKQEAKR